MCRDWGKVVRYGVVNGHISILIKGWWHDHQDGAWCNMLWRDNNDGVKLEIKYGD